MNKSNQRKMVVEEVKEIYSQYKKCDRWAVIVGISEYEYEPWNLNYAHRDAEELTKLLRSESGGNFKEEHIRLLTNKKATKRAIEDALYNFLGKPAKDDLVIIFFACHGATNGIRNHPVYFLVHDTEPAKIASTGISMEAIDTVLKHHLLSEKVIIFADTCHSGSVGGGIGANRSNIRTPQIVPELFNFSRR